MEINNQKIGQGGVQTDLDGHAPRGVRSVYLEGIKFLRIENQPSGKPTQVSVHDDMVTNFSQAERYGSLGLIAHNYLAGRYFFQLKRGDLVHVMDGKGNAKAYQIIDIRRFRALKPNDPYTLLEDLNGGEIYTAEEVFKQVYMGKPHLVLQTCLSVGGNNEWGRYFLVANPMV